MDVALGCVAVLVGLQAVSARGRGNGAAGHGQGVLAAQCVILRGDIQGARQNVEVVFRGDAVVALAVDGQGSTAGDRQVGVRVDDGVCFGIGVGGCGVCDGVVPLEGDHQVVGAHGRDGCAVRVGDGYAVQNEDDLGVLGGFDGDLAVQGAAQ